MRQVYTQEDKLREYKCYHIKHVYRMDDRSSIVIEFNEGKHLSLVAEPDCCSEAWFQHLSGYDALIDATITSIVLPGYVDEFGFVHINTDRGRCNIELRSFCEKNMYGGEVSFADKFVINELKEVTGDF